MLQAEKYQHKKYIKCRQLIDEENGPLLTTIYLSNIRTAFEAHLEIRYIGARGESVRKRKKLAIKISRTSASRSRTLVFTSMPPRTPDGLCATVIRIMIEYNDIGKAMRLTGLSLRVITSIMAIWEATGATQSRIPRPLNLTGRPRALEPGNIWVNVRINCYIGIDSQKLEYLAERLKQCPTLYLDELQSELSQVCGVEIALSTISATIKRLGITRKKVRI